MKHAVAVSLLLLTSTAFADPIALTVTSPAFTGSGSLSEALDLAEAAVDTGAPGARIEFAFTIPTQIIFDQELFISKSFDEGRELSIDGGGLVTFSGGGTTRLFFVDGQRGLFPDPDGPAGHLSLENLTLRDGFSDDTGGAIWTDGTVTLNNLLVSDNRVEVPTDPFACLFDRECEGGGAIYVGGFGILLVADTEFRNNQTRNGIGDYGGAITSGGAMFLSNSLFFNNSTGSGGGAVANGGLAVIDNTRFTGNHADGVIGGFEGGGAILNGGVASSLSGFQRLVIANSEFEANYTTGTAVDGGAILSNGELVIAQSLFTGNYVDGSISDGGAITNNGSVLTVLNTTFSNNRVIGSGEGGALETGIGPVTLVHVTMVDNDITGTTSLGGAGVASSTNPLYAVTVINSTLHGNRVLAEGNDDVYGVVRAFNSVIENTSNAVVDTAVELLTGDGAGGIVTPEGTFPVTNLVAALANNGGPTRTHAIEVQTTGAVPNPLINTADPNAAASAVAAISADSAFYLDLLGVDLMNLTDQRGIAPDGEPRNDIGAFERAQFDSDGDGIPDATDNCLEVPNSVQTDADNDGFGNPCDPDLNNDGIVNVVDLGLLRARFFSADPVADFNLDGVVNVVDLGLMRSYFFLPPGP